MTLGTFLLSISHYRTLSFFLIISIFIVDAFKNSDDEEKYNIPRKCILKQIAVCFVICLSVLLFVDYDYVEYKNVDSIMEYMKENIPIDNKIYAESSSAYLEYVGYKVYIDNRIELFLKKMNKKSDILSECFKVRNNIGIDEFLNKYNFDYLLLERKGAINYKLSNDKNYKIIKKQKVNKDEEYYLYMKVGARNEKNN